MGLENVVVCLWSSTCSLTWSGLLFGCLLWDLFFVGATTKSCDQSVIKCSCWSIAIIWLWPRCCANTDLACIACSAPSSCALTGLEWNAVDRPCPSIHLLLTKIWSSRWDLAHITEAEPEKAIPARRTWTTTRELGDNASNRHEISHWDHCNDYFQHMTTTTTTTTGLRMQSNRKIGRQTLVNVLSTLLL